MNINIDHSRTPSAKTNGTVNTGKAANIYNSNSGQLRSVAAGEIISGEISAINGKEIQITLGNDQVITARLTQNLSLTLGQMMSFQVKSNTGSQIALTPLLENMAQDSAAMKAIQASGIPLNSTTIAMTSAMMEEGMPIDKESLQNMFRIVYANEGANPASIVKMTGLALPVTPETIAQFEAYENHQHQIAGSVENLAAGISSIGSEGDLAAMHVLLDIFSGKTDPSMLAEARNEIAFLNQPILKEAPPEPRRPQNFGDIMREQEAVKSHLLTEEVHAEEKAADLAQEADPPLGNLLNGKERMALADIFRSMGMSSEKADLIQSGEMLPEDILKYTKALITLSGGNAELTKKLKDMIGGKEFQSLLKDGIAKQWLLSPEDVGDKDKVTELYKKILTQTDRTLQMLNQMGKGDSALAKGTENLKQNVNFMNQLNQIFAYVQLPLKMSRENAHGDLYVYAKKRRLTEEDGSCSALLHLEMEHLGMMDIHVALNNGNEVKTHFYLEKEEMLDFIEENIGKLDERLRKRGYQVSTNASVRTPEKTSAETKTSDNMVLDQMIGSGRGKHLVAKYSFDVRA